MQNVYSSRTNVIDWYNQEIRQKNIHMIYMLTYINLIFHIRNNEIGKRILITGYTQTTTATFSLC